MPAPDTASWRRDQPLRRPRGGRRRRSRGARHASGLPGAVGPAEEAARFADALVALDRCLGPARRSAARPRRGEGPPRASGTRAYARDPSGRRSLAIAWLRAFADEALGEAPHLEDIELTYRRRESDPNGAWLVWDDDGPVSFAGYGNPTPSGIRVGPVYTPPEHRGRGYATSLVADLTAERLAAGLEFCFLFTDLTNPTSNAIYARIGYEPVADWDQWAFEPLQGLIRACR